MNLCTRPPRLLLVLLVTTWMLASCHVDGEAEESPGSAAPDGDRAREAGEFAPPTPDRSAFASLEVCASAYQGFASCCDYDADSQVWTYSSEPCPGSTDCALGLDCPAGYRETVRDTTICACYSLDQGDQSRSACDASLGCPDGYYRLSYVSMQCVCEPLGVGSCPYVEGVPLPDGTEYFGDMFDVDPSQGCPLEVGFGYAYECFQRLSEAEPLQLFCSACPCPTVDHVVPVVRKQDDLVFSYNSCLSRGSNGSTCCTYDPAKALWRHMDHPCPGMDDCNPGRDCPAGYVELTDDAGKCVCRPLAPSASGVDAEDLTFVSAQESCPAPRDSAYMFRCPLELGESARAFCSPYPCPGAPPEFSLTEGAQ